MIALVSGLSLALAVGCGSSTESGTAGPGPLVDNTLWEVTTDGAELIGTPPADAVCELEPMDCGDLYPWPEGECVTLTGTPCVTAYVPECLDTYTVLAVYTRMPNPAEPLCNWLTLEQPSLRDIRAGDQIEVRMYHAALTAPTPDGFARVMFTIGDQVVVDYQSAIPSDSEFFPRTRDPVSGELVPDRWIADKDYPAGTQLLFHVDNHGQNEYLLIEANIL